MRSMIEYLVLYNFKSYAGEHTIGPFLDFSAVIGPNGGGKSNLMDAISFVFGVRSMDLRAPNLKELIYRQEGESALENLRSAYVEVHFKCAGDDLVLKRTISNNGGSEYQVNSNKFSQESYQEMLRSLNINVQAKNFLIFQGQVDSLAMKSGKELTTLFEKISGSDLLKHDYEDAKKHMDDCEEHMRGLGNRIKYLSNELKQLKEQKKNYQKYETELQEVRKLQTDILLIEIIQIERQFKGKTQEIENDQRELIQIDRERQRFTKEIQEQGSEIEHKTAETREISSELSRAGHILMLRRPELSKIKENISKFESGILLKQGSLEEITREIQQLCIKERKLQERLEMLDRELRSVLEQQTQQMAFKLNNKMKEEYLTLKRQVGIKTYSEQRELDRLFKDLTTKNLCYSHTRQALLRKTEELSGLEADLRSTVSLIHSKTSEKERSIKNIENKQDSLSKLSTKVERLRTQEIQVTATIANLENSLREIEIYNARRKERTAERRLIEHIQKQKKGIKGKFGDLVHPTQDQFNVAFKTALKGVMDYLIVDTLETANFINQKLKEHSIQSTLIILENIPEVHSEEELRYNVQGKGSLLIDLLTYDRSLEKAVKVITKGHVVTQTIDEAGTARGIPGVKQIVTLDGITIKNGMISAGGNQKIDKQELKSNKIIKELTGQKEMLKSLQGKMNDLREIDSLKNEIENSQNSIKCIDIEIEGLTEKTHHLEKLQFALQQEIDNLKEEEDAAERNTSHTREMYRQLEEQRRKTEDTVFASFCKRVGVRNIREIEGKSLVENKKLQENVDTLRNEIAAVSWSIEKLDKNQKQETFQKLSSALENDQTELEKLKEKHYEVETEIQQSKQIQNDLEGNEQSNLNLIKNLTKKKTALENDCSKLLTNLSAKETEKGIKEKALEHLQAVKFQKIEEAIVKNLNIPIMNYPQEPEIDFSAVDRDTLELNDSQIETEIDRINHLIERHNSAIEKISNTSYNQNKIDLLNERIKDIHSELEQATGTFNTAKQTFENTKQERKDIFMATFNTIANSIAEIYKDMTKSEKNFYQGGNALLYLENKDEPFDSGIVYSPTPPGKRCMYEMEQLSGGEKTIAALSLLFAMHSAVPSPFYILDEVDAFLDWNNCQLLLAYLQKMSEHRSQVIVITHKEEFYSNADSLIGATYAPQQLTSMSFSLDLRRYGPKQIMTK